MKESDMDRFFYDTSAFVKYFNIEEGSDIVFKLIDTPENETWITELTTVEFYSALYRKFRNRNISEIQLQAAMDGYNEEIANYNVENITSYTFKQSQNIILEYGKEWGLRSLDALQIAAFVIIAEKEWTFVSSDNIACNVVNRMGFKIINPITVKHNT